MAVKKMVKKSKPKKRQVKRPTQNQSVKQTVIIQQAPAPKRRRRSTATPKKSRDKFDVPSSGLGVVTNLIEKIVNLQSEQSKVNKGLTQIQEDKELLKIEDAPAPQTVTSFQPPDATKRSESYTSNVSSVTGSTFSIDTGRSGRAEQDLSGFEPKKSILSNPIRKVSGITELSTTKLPRTNSSLTSSTSTISETKPSLSSPNLKVDGLISLTDTKTTQASSTLPEPLDMPPKLVSPKKQKMLLSNFFSPKKKVVSYSSSFSSGGAVGGGGGGDSLEDQLSALSISSSQIETRNAKKKIKEAENDLLTKKSRLDNAVSKGTVKEGTLKSYESQLKASQDRLQKLKDKS